MLQDGWTPLIYASEEGHLDVCELLLNRGADVNLKDNVCDISYSVT